MSPPVASPETTAAVASPSITSASIKDDQPDNEKHIGTDSTPEGDPEWVTGKAWAVIMVGICITNFMALLDTAVLATALPYITDDFHATADVGWLGAAYFLAMASLQPLVGKLYMSFKSRATYLAFNLIFSVGTLICALATSANMLIVGRAVTGMGTAGIASGAIIVISQCKPMQDRPAVIGQLMAIVQLGILLGPLIGGALAQHLSWRWIFWIQLPISAAGAAALAFLGLPERIVKPPARVVIKELHKRMDLVGFVIFTSAVIMLITALEYGGNSYAWNSSTVIGLFCGAGATTLVFVAWTWHKGDQALISVVVLRKRPVLMSAVVIFSFAAATYGLSYYLPIYFQAVKGKSPTLSGVYLLPVIISQMIASVGSGKLVSKVGYYLPFSVAGGVLMSIAHGLFTTLSPSTTTGEWIGYEIIAGISRGLSIQMPFLAAQNCVAPAEIPMAMGFITFAQTFGGALGLSFADTIFTNSLRTLVPEDAPGVSAELVIAAGANDFREEVPQSELANVLMAYAGSIDRVFYLLTAFAAMVAIFSFGIGWKDVRAKKSMAK